MKLRVVQSARAVRDVTDHFAFIARDNLDAALRFLEEYDRAARTIAEFPEIGSERVFRSRRLKTVRLWTPDHFDKYIIAYQIHASSVLIFRVLHSAQDVTRL